MAPIFSAGALTIEKEQRTLPGLLTSLLGPLQIWWGKFVASLMFILLLLVIGIPVLSAVFAFGGVGPWEVGIVAFTTVVILGTVSAISLYWSSAVSAQRACYGGELRLGCGDDRCDAGYLLYCGYSGLRAQPVDGMRPSR